MDPRFTLENGTGIFTGNELIVKGGLEGGMGLMTGYPGSPWQRVFDAAERIRDLLVENGVMVQIANNEALGAARLNGAQMEAIRAIAVMKSVGAHVASDALALGNMAGTARAPQRSRYLATIRGPRARRCRPIRVSSPNTCTCPCSNRAHFRK